MESTEMTLGPMASESIERLLLIDSVGSALAFPLIPSWHISFTKKLVSEYLAMPTFVALQCSEADPTVPSIRANRLCKQMPVVGRSPDVPRELNSCAVPRNATEVSFNPDP